MIRVLRAIAVGTVLVFVTGGSGQVLSATETAASNGAVPLPEIARGRGDACVEDTDFMRRNHMNLLLHKRDQTMHQGIRTRQYSLIECLACHVVDGADAQPVSIANSRHFCRSCHDYAAVSVDCFQCHASRPGEESRAAPTAPELSQ